MTACPTSGKYRILLVDDHAMFCQGLAGLFAGQPDCEIVAYSSSPDEALRILQSNGIDLLMLDLDLGDSRGSELLAQARRNGYAGPVLVVTADATPVELGVVAALGIAGVVRKDAPFEVLVAAARRAATGTELYTASNPAKPRRELTIRECQVIRGVFNGLSNKEIAFRMSASEASVKGILQQVFDKAGVRTRAQLVRVALERYSDQL